MKPSVGEWADCECGRGRYNVTQRSSCRECFLDHSADYVPCLGCGTRSHQASYDTCYHCSPQGVDKAVQEIRQLILWRDSLTCRICHTREGDQQLNPRFVRAACPPGCAVIHNHHRRCPEGCEAGHDHLPGCPPGCKRVHEHRRKDDDGQRQATMLVSFIVPASAGGERTEWNLHAVCGVCHITHGGDWYPGCAYDLAKTRLVRMYLQLSNHFTADVYLQICREWAAFRAAGTWTPVLQRDWLQRMPPGTCRVCHGPMTLTQYPAHPSCDPFLPANPSIAESRI